MPPDLPRSLLPKTEESLDEAVALLAHLEQEWVGANRVPAELFVCGGVRCGCGLGKTLDDVARELVGSYAAERLLTASPLPTLAPSREEDGLRGAVCGAASLRPQVA